jgi:hypothetical protein
MSKGQINFYKDNMKGRFLNNPSFPAAMVNDIAILVEENDRFSWSDSKRQVTVQAIGNPVEVDFSGAHESWYGKPYEYAMRFNFPSFLLKRGHEDIDRFKATFPHRTQFAFYVVEKALDSKPPYLKVQYVAALAQSRGRKKVMDPHQAESMPLGKSS